MHTCKSTQVGVVQPKGLNCFSSNFQQYRRISRLHNKIFRLRRLAQATLLWWPICGVKFCTQVD